MPNRIKEEERIERTIRSLLKLPENRRCINCNNLGPQYVCTTFWTFVCTNCSGVHREFTHRVKSVSMAKFNAEEVSGALQAGGNERARQIYFREWDPQRNTFPDCNNLHRLRDFIKHVYVDRKYMGESSHKLSMVRVGAKDDLYAQRSFERSSQKGGRDEHPSFERSSDDSSLGGKNDDKTLRHLLDERRSPRYKHENVRPGGHRSRPAHFEVVDDRFRDDGHGSGRPSRRFSQTSREMTGFADGSAHDQKPAPSTSLGSVDGKAGENKSVNSSSLMDLISTNSETPAAAEPQTQHMVLSADVENTSCQSSTLEKASKAPVMNSLEFLLFELSGPAVAPGGMSEESTGGEPPSAAPVASSNSVNATEDGSATHTQVIPSNVVVPTASAVGHVQELLSDSDDNMDKVTDQQQLPTMQQEQPSKAPGGDSSSTAQPNTTSVEDALFNEPWTSSPPPDAQGGPPSASSEQSSQTDSKLAQDTLAVDGSISTARKELPVDLFTSRYQSFPAAVPSCQFHPPQGMEYGIQYLPTAMPMQASPNPAKSTNPFDLTDDNTRVQASTFPSVSSLQEALPTGSASTGLQIQSLPYASAQPSYGPIMSSGAYMGQPLPNNMPISRPEGIGSSGSEESAFAFLNPIQQSSGRYLGLNAPNSSPSAGGNPFE